MIFEYDDESETTLVVLDDEEIGSVEGRIVRTRNGIPHPETNQFGEFEKIIHELNSPKERKALLHLLTGAIDHREVNESDNG